MDEQFITCPRCGEKIPLSEALTHQIEDGLRQSLEAEYSRKFSDDKAKIEQDAERKAAERLALELKDRDEQIKEKSELLEAAQAAEVQLRKKTREIEDRERNLERDLQRQLDEQREIIRQEAALKAAEDHRLSDREKDEQLTALRRQLEEMQRKMEQGSQQAQGEALELELEDLLRERFPYDDIEPVPKGMRGADVIQTIRDSQGQACGAIIWESKRAKSWSNDWIPKLKDDMLAARADIAIITTTVYPKGAERLGEIDGVWVTDFSLCVGLASALRQQLLQLARLRCAQEGSSGKKDLMYNYVSGPEFRQRVEAMVEPFAQMQHDLIAEKRAINKVWSKREKQIERVMLGAAGLHGDLEAIVGSALPGVRALELPGAGEDDADEYLGTAPEEQEPETEAIEEGLFD